MPLIIVVLFIIVLFTGNARASQQARDNAEYQKQYKRITNAPLEALIFHNYIKHGFSYSDCIKKTKEAIASIGFEPCIPESAYNDGNNNNTRYTSSISNVTQYDSRYIQEKRRAVLDPIEKYCDDHNIKYSVSPLYVDSRVYKNFPIKGIEDYKSKYIQNNIVDYLKIESVIQHKLFGYCKIIEIDYDHQSIKVKQLRSNEELTILFDDDNIIADSLSN